MRIYSKTKFDNRNRKSYVTIMETILAYIVHELSTMQITLSNRRFDVLISMEVKIESNCLICRQTKIFHQELSELNIV